MNILICGASGFVGRHLQAALQSAGHTCIRGVRQPRTPADRAVDYLQDVTVEAWLPKLQGIDAVINAVGILRDSRAQPMAKILAAAPQAMFAACARAGVKRIVNFSALGVEGPVATAYFQYRREAEAVLFALPAEIRWLNLRPSLIYGEDGASARWFRQLAALPLHALPMGGRQALQPVHIKDVAAAACRWLGDPDAVSQSANAAGGAETTLRGMLDSYRAQLGYKPALHVAVPGMLVKLGARIGDFLPFSPLCTDTLTMLNAGNTGDNSRFAQLLGRRPLDYTQFLTEERAR